MRHAHSGDQSGLLEKVALALNSTLDLKEVLGSLAEIVLETSGADRCSLFLLDGTHLRPAVAITDSVDEDLWGAFRSMGPVDLRSIPDGPQLLTAGHAVAVEDAASCELVPRLWTKRFSLRSLVLVPLLAAGEPCGLMAVDYRQPRGFRGTELRLLEAIASSAGIAVRNARLYEQTRAAATERAALLDRLEQRVRQLHVLHRLSATLAEGVDATVLVERLNELLAEGGIQVAGIAFRDRRVAARLGGQDPTSAEREAWRTKAGPIPLADGTLSVPMHLGRRLVGSLRVGPPELELDDLAFVQAIAWGVGEVATLGALRAEAEEATRERVVAAERSRIAADLHDTAGQIFVAVGLLARGMAEQLPPDSPWFQRARRLGDLAGRGKWEIDQAVRALAFVPAARRGLAPALKALGRSFEGESGIAVVVDVEGKPVRLTPRVERALYRVAHEALSNAWQHSRCTAIRIDLSFGRTHVVTRVVDDGIGLGSRAGSRSPGFGMSGMRKAMDEVAGTLRVRPGRKRGLVVEATVRKEAR